MIHDLAMMERRAMHSRLTPGCHVSAEQDSDATLFNRALNLPARLALEINELSFLIQQLGLRDKLKSVYPFIGCDIGIARTAARDLRRTTVGTFGANWANWVYAKTGIKGNGSTTAFNTGWSPFSNLSAFNHHLAYYSRTSGAATGYYMGANSATSVPPRCNMYFLSTDKLRSYSHSTMFEVASGGGSSGFIVISRSANNSQKIFKNGSQLGSTDTAVVSGNYPTASIFIGAANNGVNVGQAHGNTECAFASMGDSLTDAEVSALNYIVQRYNTRLCRNV